MIKTLQYICFRDLLVGLCSPHLLSPGSAFHNSTQVCFLTYFLPEITLFPAPSSSQRMLSQDCICIQFRVEYKRLNLDNGETLNLPTGIRHWPPIMESAPRVAINVYWLKSFFLINPQSNPRKSKIVQWRPLSEKTRGGKTKLVQVSSGANEAGNGPLLLSRGHHVLALFYLPLCNLDTQLVPRWPRVVQSQKNPVSASAMLTGEFLRIRKVFATSSLFAEEFPDILENIQLLYKIFR